MRLTSLLAAVLISFAMSTSDAFAANKKPKIGFILSTMQEERYQKDKKYFTEAVEKAGGEVVFASCNNSEATQAAEVDNMLSRGIDVLVIQPVNGNTASAFVKQAIKDKVKVVAYDRLIENALIDAWVTENSIRVGQLQAEAAVKATGGKGNFVILKGQAGHTVAEARTKGALEVLKKHPGIKIVVEQYHQGWSPNLAMATMENALTKNKNNIQAVIANNSGMAHGAVQALEAQKLTGKVFVAGADADLANIKNMIQGKQQYEVVIPITEMASRAASVAMDLAQGKEFKFDSVNPNGSGNIKTLNASVFGLDKSEIEARIIKTGYHTREAIYGK